MKTHSYTKLLVYNCTELNHTSVIAKLCYPESNDKKEITFCFEYDSYFAQMSLYNHYNHLNNHISISLRDFMINCYYFIFNTHFSQTLTMSKLIN